MQKSEQRMTDKEKAVEFVELVKSYPGLYNTSLPEYGRKDYTERAWIEVAEQTNSTVNDSKERWRNYRNSFVRCRKAGRRYYLTEHMQFLQKYVKKSKTSEENKKGDISYSSRDDQFEDTKDNFEEVYAEDTLFFDDPTVETVDKPEMPIPKKIKRDDVEIRYLADAEMKTPSNPVESTTRTRRENYREMFFLSLMPDVEKLTDENFMQFRINTILDLQKFILHQTQNTIDDDSS